MSDISKVMAGETDTHSGGARISHWGRGAEPLGAQPPMQALFGENVCENERIGSHWGGRRCWRHPPGSDNDTDRQYIQIDRQTDRQTCVKPLPTHSHER